MSVEDRDFDITATMTPNEFEKFQQQQVAMAQATAQIVDVLDGLKKGLERKGWEPNQAAQASIAVGNTVIMMSQGGFN